jgi:hypothetical protein
LHSSISFLASKIKIQPEALYASRGCVSSVKDQCVWGNYHLKNFCSMLSAAVKRQYYCSHFLPFKMFLSGSPLRVGLLFVSEQGIEIDKLGFKSAFLPVY